MKGNPYKIGKGFSISPRIKQWLSKLPSLKGREGRWYRRALIAIACIPVVILVIHFLKPETTLMSSVEIKRVEAKGILTVGVRDDVPGFCEEGEGLEAELARLLAERLLPESEDPLRLVTCSSSTVSTKLKDGSIDVAIALQPKDSSSAYSYSYPYYTDTVWLVTLDKANTGKLPSDMRVGYNPETPAGKLFSTYMSKLTAVRDRTIIDRVLGRPAPTADPATAITFDAVKFGSFDELINALKKGDIDAAVMAGAFVNKYFEVYAESTGVREYYLCNAVIGSLEYCVIASSDDPALTQVADMLIYKLQEDGSLAALALRHGLRVQ